MQFLPIVTSTGNAAIAQGLSESAQQAPFLDSLNRELAALGVVPVVSPSVRPGVAPGFSAISPDTGSKLDADDLTYMRKAAGKRGLDESVLNVVEGPLTIGNILKHVASGKRTGGELADEDAALITGALAKMGIGQEVIDEIGSMLDSGNAHGALAAMKKHMGDNTFVLNRSEKDALLRGLELSGGTAKQIAALFGEEETRSLDKGAFAKLFGPASAELAENKKTRDALVREMRGIIEEALEAKKTREAFAPVSDMRGSRQTERAEAKMLDDLTAKGKNLVSRGASGQDDLQDGRENSDSNADLAREDMRRDAAEAFMKNAVPGARSHAASEAGTNPAREGLSSVFNRMEAVADVSGAASSVAATPAAAQAVAQPLYAPHPGSAEAHMADTRRQEIFSQVEKGLLRQMADGSTRMTLRLDPADLGRVTLLLTVKNNEVRALIRTENPETTTALAEQMSRLRASLEEQGLKVAELEVETRLPQDAGTRQWSDTAEFNREQEMREQARFARLARSRREAGASLAQDMQSTMRREEISSPANGLHIIA